MFFKVGLLSLVLLLASRVLGVLRETAVAAAFGSSGMADVVIVMLTLPDWLAGVLVSGALSYVLLPQWARESGLQQNATQRRVAGSLLLLAVALAGAMYFARDPVGALLAPGLSPALQTAAGHAVAWSALALPAAMLAALWATRLQHERDFVGLYSANLVVNGVLVLGTMVTGALALGATAGAVLGFFLLAAMGLRLVWQVWRLRPFRCSTLAPRSLEQAPLPGWRVWLWAVLAAGLPLTLPLVARTFASAQGEGGLATFNYAWKLVELPLVLVIQLAASLAFPAIARAHAKQAAVCQRGDDMATAVRKAVALAFTLACAAAAALLVGAPALTALLFGWGRMQGPALELIANWGSVGAWGLLPQSFLAVGLTVLATLGRMRVAVLAYALALALLLLARAAGLQGGGQLMGALSAGYLVAALVVWGALGRSALQQWLPLQTLLASLVALLVVVILVHIFGSTDVVPLSRGASADFSARFFAPEHLLALIFSALAALFVIALAGLLSVFARRVQRP